MINLEDKVFEGIISWFKDKNQKAIVALSGGVDSAVLQLLRIIILFQRTN